MLVEVEFLPHVYVMDVRIYIIRAFVAHHK
jgi:hypothetical protein